MKSQLFAATMCLGLMSGCSSMPSLPELPSLGKSEDPIVTALQGKSTSYVEGRLGLPNRRTDSPSGAMVWTYLDNERGATAKVCEVTLSIRNDVVENVYIARENKSLMSFVSSACDRIREEVLAKS